MCAKKCLSKRDHIIKVSTVCDFVNPKFNGQHLMIESVVFNSGIRNSDALKVEYALSRCNADEDIPSALCSIMREEKSDKGSGPKGNHNYTLLYDSLFNENRHSTNLVFEVGLGTNFPDVPSSMGVNGTPGASLRGWARYFPAAKIYGADIDKRILFAEDRISTFFIDQLNSEIIKDAIIDFPEKGFDIVLDDGLHTYEANSNLYENANYLVRPGGYYIIEDINSSPASLAKFVGFLQSIDFPSILLRLPHPINKTDNCVAVITH